jgi:hypothetical protein
LKSNWYKNGLYFKCKKNCDNCCSKSPGYVWISNEEQKKIASFLKISLNEFLKKYTRNVNGRVSLLENLINFDCVFLKDKKCSIYDARPIQCKTFPFWKGNLLSKKSWDSLKEDCPGIDDKSGKLFSENEIQKILDQ